MDISISTTGINTNTTAASTSIKTPEAETETPTRIQNVKLLSISNGVLKRHQPLQHHHHQNYHAVVVTYKECLKNHAASLGGHAVDGCGEFMPSPTSNPTDPTSLKCAACGCHRNFHRREPEEPLPLALPPPNTTPALEYQPHHRHHPPPPTRSTHSSPSSPSPPPISSSYYPSAPHMLLALSSGMSGPPTDNNTHIISPGNTSSGRKRFRTKFTQDQKEKMLEFAEKVGWKIQRRDDDVINGFCNEVGIDRGVLKVWMHNNKNTLGKKDLNANIAATTTDANNASGSGIGFGSAVAATTGNHYHHQDDNKKDVQNLSHHQLHNTNGSSSSS